MTVDNSGSRTGRLASLADGLRDLELDVDGGTLQLLIDYVELLTKWNLTYNLTAIRHPDEMLSHHLLDSLAVSPFLLGKSLLDIGTGAGLPGLPLALCRPDLEVVLLESRGKKARFVQQAVLILGLSNVTIVHDRVENYQPAEKFDTLISRAFAPVAQMLDLAGHLCRNQGRILAMKGKYPTTELAGVETEKYHIDEVIELRVPNLEAERHLVMITPRN